MNEMIDRVAGAIYEESQRLVRSVGYTPWKDVPVRFPNVGKNYENLAIAAISAMGLEKILSNALKYMHTHEGIHDDHPEWEESVQKAFLEICGRQWIWDGEVLK